MKLQDIDSDSTKGVYFFKDVARKTHEGKPIGISAKGIAILSKGKIENQGYGDRVEVGMEKETFLERFLSIASLFTGAIVLMRFALAPKSELSPILAILFASLIFAGIIRLFIIGRDRYIQIFFREKWFEFPVSKMKWDEFEPTILSSEKARQLFTFNNEKESRNVLRQIFNWIVRVWRWLNDVD